MLEGKVKHLRQQGRRKRPNAASALTSEEEEYILWTAKPLGDSTVQELFLRRCGGQQLRAANVERQSYIQVTGHANEKSLNDYDEEN